jgi:hypothetical protein
MQLGLELGCKRRVGVLAGVSILIGFCKILEEMGSRGEENRHVILADDLEHGQGERLEQPI